MSFSILYVTFPDREEARRISDLLMGEKRIACSNLLPIEACYWWQGTIEKEGEVAGILKTSNRLWKSVSERIESLHPYEVPCIIRMEVTANDAYEQWIEDSVLDN